MLMNANLGSTYFNISGGGGDERPMSKQERGVT